MWPLHTYMRLHGARAGRDKIDYVFVSHTEPDHSGLIPAVLDAHPDAIVCGSKVALTFLQVRGAQRAWARTQSCLCVCVQSVCAKCVGVGVWGGQVHLHAHRLPLRHTRMHALTCKHMRMRTHVLACSQTHIPHWLLAAGSVRRAACIDLPMYLSARLFVCVRVCKPSLGASIPFPAMS